MVREETSRPTSILAEKSGGDCVDIWYPSTGRRDGKVHETKTGPTPFCSTPFCRATRLIGAVAPAPEHISTI